MLVKSKFFSRTYFSPTYRKSFTNILHQHTFKFMFKMFTNIQKIFHQHTAPTYSSFHQHTENFSPTYFTNIHINFCPHQHTASPTYRKFFTNILVFTNIFHQHHYSPAYLIHVQSFDLSYAAYRLHHFVWPRVEYVIARYFQNFIMWPLQSLARIFEIESGANHSNVFTSELILY